MWENGSFDVPSRPFDCLITILTQAHSLFSIIVYIFALSSIYLLHISFKRHQAVRATYPPGPASWRVHVKEVLSRHYRFKQKSTDRDYDDLHKTYGPLVMINRSSGMELLLGNDQVCEDLLVQRAHINSSRPAVEWHQSVRLLQNRDLMFWQVGQINKDWQQSQVDLSINRIAQNFERSDQEIRRLSISLNTCAVFKIPIRDTQAAEFIKLEQMLQNPSSGMPNILPGGPMASLGRQSRLAFQIHVSLKPRF
ncbi:hypothetical protein CROQUDRAFT_227944 [Cronartium quercuum f. sp. fusiforme G11]|uniref:Cytochrome P450 n=1 Tax=Cronartium quercuum f. sp. fusiforme G11 TaxID=708437 RepID=A0A9P6NTS7_9BASI|nr:hypothetical protein CROQUDRAFT_227944 [Cronartium quercuum f. sp. fusiforme G11]